MKFIATLESMYKKCSDAAMVRYIVNNIDYMARNKHYKAIDTIYKAITFEGMPAPVIFSLFAMTNSIREHLYEREAAIDRARNYVLQYREPEFCDELFAGVIRTVEEARK